MRETQAVVIGSGPGGYVCAIRLAQLGVETLVIEAGAVGGVCLNVGCIPSKALVNASKLVARIGEAEVMGIKAGPVEIDFARMLAWKAEIVTQLTSGVAQLVTKNGAQILAGRATFIDDHTLSVATADGEETVRFDSAVIATGSVAAQIPGFDFDGRHVVGSTDALAFERIPDALVVIGGGYIGMELGSVYQRLGTRVTVVEMLDQLLPGFDRPLVRPVAKRFGAAGGEVLTGTRALGWRAVDGGVEVDVARVKDGETRTLTADAVLLTIGRRPRSAGLDLEAAGVAVDAATGFIPVDPTQRTNVPHIYAIGDVAGEPMLAHKASKEGEVAAEVIAGHDAAFTAKAIPAVVFTDPEIASVGLGAKEARKAKRAVKTGMFSFAANGRALALNEGEGFVRLVVDADSGVVLGMEAVGPEVSDLIAEGALAVELGLKADDLGAVIHAHPTLAEVTMEAANAALGRAVHVLGRRRRR